MRFERNCLELFYTLSMLVFALSETWSTWEENFPSYVSGRQIMRVLWVYWWDGKREMLLQGWSTDVLEAWINSVHTHDYIFLYFSQEYQQIQPATLSLCQQGVRKHLVNQKFPTTNKSANFFELLVCSASCCWCSLHKWSLGWQGHCVAIYFQQDQFQCYYWSRW